MTEITASLPAGPPEAPDEPSTRPGIGRRAVLSGVLCAAGSGGAAAQAQPALAKRIDVHAHFLPAEYRRQLLEAGYEHPDGMPGIPAWSPQLAQSMMDRLNIQASMLSVSSPGVHFGDDAAARRLARLVNEAGAQAARDFPNRFGLFASVPLPDVDGALAEAAYALDTLGADGIAVETNHGGTYLGDRRFEPFFAELNRRRAVVFMHPTSPVCPGCQALSLGYPRPMIEFMFETTRAVTNLLLTRTLSRHSDIRLIIPHAGAALPALVDRIIGILPAAVLAEPVAPDEILSTLRRCYYDLAGYPLPRLAPALLQIATPDHILYGSDWPWTPLAKTTILAETLEATPIFDEAMRRAILLDNALRLFPRLQQ